MRCAVQILHFWTTGKSGKLTSESEMVAADSVTLSHTNQEAVPGPGDLQVLSEFDASAASLSHVSKRLCIKDGIPGITFLIDTGADVFIVSASASQKEMEPSGPCLYAANHSSIKTYGIEEITVSLNLR